MKKLISIIFLVIAFFTISCDAPSPFTWQGDYQHSNDIFNLVSTVVGTLEADANPESISSVDDRVVITATVKSVIGTAMQNVNVTFTTDTGFFRSDEYGPSEIFTTPSDSEGKAYAHLIRVSRTCTIKVEAGGLIVHVVVTFD